MHSQASNVSHGNIYLHTSRAMTSIQAS